MELAEVVGSLAALRRFPVRGLGGEAPDEARVQGSGLAGDRVFDLYDEQQGALMNARTAPFLVRYRARYLDAMVGGDDFGPWIRVRKPDGEEVGLSDREWVDDVSRRCGRSVRLRVTGQEVHGINRVLTDPDHVPALARCGHSRGVYCAFSCEFASSA